jgi:hypothetical protein
VKPSNEPRIPTPRERNPIHDLARIVDDLCPEAQWVLVQVARRLKLLQREDGRITMDPDLAKTLRALERDR